jgi:hypothetical protein
VPPSNRATISRLPLASYPKLDWLHSVVAKAALSLALTAVWKLSYAMNDGLLPTQREICSLNAGLDFYSRRQPKPPAMLTGETLFFVVEGFVKEHFKIRLVA